MNMERPSEQLTKLIMQAGLTCPMVMTIREGVVNGVEANERRTQVVDSKNRNVIITKDWEHQNKLSIINYDGEYLSEDKVNKHLNTLGWSGNEEADDILGLGQNFGHGIKISYLTWASDGILYRTKRANTDEGIMFHLKRHANGQIGLADFYCTDTEEYDCFPACYDFSDHLSYERAGTEIVLMGNCQEEDTWARFNKECSLSGQGAPTGVSIRKWLSNRFWTNIPNHDIKIQIHNSKGEPETRSTASRDHFLYRKVTSVYKQMQEQSMYGNFAIEGSIDGIEGVVAHWCRIDKRKEHNHSLNRGFVGFALNKEFYCDFNNHKLSNERLRMAGIFSKQSQWAIAFELPSQENMKVRASKDRTYLQNLNVEPFLSCFRKNMPDEILAILRQDIDKQIDTDDVKKWLKEHFANILGKSPKSKTKNNIEVLSSDNKATKPSARINKQNFSSKKSKKMSSQRLKIIDIPEPRLYSGEPDEPLVYFDYIEYSLNVNSSNPVFTKRVDRLKSELRNVGLQEIVSEVYKYTCKGAYYRIYMVHDTKSLTLQEKQDRWSPSILEATWNSDTESAINRVLKVKDRARDGVAA